MLKTFLLLFPIHFQTISCGFVKPEAYVIQRNYNPQTAYKTTGDNLGDYSIRMQTHDYYMESSILSFDALSCSDFTSSMSLRMFNLAIPYHQSPGPIKIYGKFSDINIKNNAPSVIGSNRKNYNMSVYSDFHDAVLLGNTQWQWYKEVYTTATLDLSSVSCSGSNKLLLFLVPGDNYVAGAWGGPSNQYTNDWGLEVSGKETSTQPLTPGPVIDLSPNICGTFTTMTFNVENLFPQQKQMGAIADMILRAPVDVIALQEIGDNNGAPVYGWSETQDEIIDASETLNALIDAIKAKDANVVYDFIDGQPEQFNSGGGWPGVNIRNAFLYKKSGNNPIAYAGSKVPDWSAHIDPTKASYRLMNPNSTLIPEWRPPLVATFQKCSQSFTAVSAHFKPGTGTGRSDVRLLEGKFLSTELSELAKSNSHIVALGDFNDIEGTVRDEFVKRDWDALWKTNVYINENGEVKEGRPSGPWTYNTKDWNSQLDNIFVPQRTMRPEVFSDLLHLTQESDRYHESDHQPIVARLHFNSQLSCDDTSMVYQTRGCCNA